MIKKILCYITLGLLVFTPSIAFTQNVGINTTGTTPNASAILDLNTGNSGGNVGLLPPQVSLSAVGTWNPPMTLGTAVVGMIVYNTNATVTGGNGVGYYYWGANSQWNYMMNAGTNTAWLLKGNASITSPAAPLTYGTSTFASTENWLGTTDAHDLTFGTSNIERMRILSSGYVGIGTAAPASLFEIDDATGAFTIGNLVTITGNSLTTGKGVYLSSTSLTTGSLLDVEATNSPGGTGNCINTLNNSTTGNAI